MRVQVSFGIVISSFCMFNENIKKMLDYMTVQILVVEELDYFFSDFIIASLINISFNS